MSIRSVTVFCASSDGFDPALLDAARKVGHELASRGIRVVYGGGGTGLMGALADGALAAGGEVVGVIPSFMVEREWGRNDLTQLHVVETMHQRKALMANLADGFVVLPGGIGTLEEFFEVWTWRQIGLVDKPVGLFDAGGFWQPLVRALGGLVKAGFVPSRTLDELVVTGEVDDLLRRLDALGGDGQLVPAGA